MPTHIEVIDRPNGENDQAAKYQNSYRLESANPFHAESVEKLVESVMGEKLESFVYDSKEGAKTCLDIATEIRKQIGSLEFDRYKIIVAVSIVEKRSQAVETSVGFLWDSERDSFATHTRMGDTFYSTCLVLGVYYE